MRGHREFTSGRTLLLSPQPTATLLSVGGLRLMQSVSHGVDKCSRPIPIEVFWFGVCLLVLQWSPVSPGFWIPRWNLALSGCLKRNWTFGGAGGETCRNSGSSSPTITN